MRSADTTAIIAAALREDADRLGALLDDLSTRDLSRITDAARLIERQAVLKALSARLAERGANS